MTPQKYQAANVTTPPAILRVSLTNIDVAFGCKGIVVLAPHPDDEILGCGAVLAAMASLGRSVCVIYLTDGGASQYSASPEARETLVQLRQREAREGLAQLGVPSDCAVFIAAPDGGLEPCESAHSRLKIELQSLAQGNLVSSVFVTSLDDGHPDHQAAYQIAIDAVRAMPDIQLFAYPISSRIDQGSPLDPTGKFPIVFDAAPFAARKRAALHCHKSQLVADPEAPGFTLSPATVDLMCQGPEYFSKVDFDYER